MGNAQLYEPLLRMVESLIVGYDQLGLVKRRQGNRMEEDSPRNAYETADGRWITISASSPATFARLMKAIQRLDLVEDPRFRTNEDRVRNVEALDEIIGAWFKVRLAKEAEEMLQAYDVVAGPIYSVQDILNDLHIQARHNIVSVFDEDFGELRMQGVTPVLSRTPGEVRHAGRTAVGADNEEILMGELGLSPSDLAELRQGYAI